MKSAKAMQIDGAGCVVQVTTQQGKNVAEALVFVPDVAIVDDINGGRKLVSIDPMGDIIDFGTIGGDEEGDPKELMEDVKAMHAGEIIIGRPPAFCDDDIIIAQNVIGSIFDVYGRLKTGKQFALSVSADEPDNAETAARAYYPECSVSHIVPVYPFNAKSEDPGAEG